jgi:hypothetical protein
MLIHVTLEDKIIYNIQGDSKLLLGFLWPVGMKVKVVMNNPPSSCLWYT